ncbi:MAG: T9SS type A sorting domain-containing protein [candidate division Zixibacteria bacterium]|nr:T9SS type A sorting domain-containing protein [candidate division Zixibacteria bacterium]
MRNFITFLISLFFAFTFTSLASAQPTKTMPPRHYNFPLGNEISPDTPVYPYNHDVSSHLTRPVGYTYWDVQSIGSSGNRIAYCDDGTKYLTWTNLVAWPYPPAPRHVYYNWCDYNGNWISPEEGSQVSENSYSGFPSIDCMGGNIGVIAYHKYGGGGPNGIFVSIEWDPPGMGFFSHYTVPNEIYPQNDNFPGLCYWPQVAVDRNDNIHIIMHEKTDIGPFRIAYTRSEDGGVSWLPPEVIGTCSVIGAVIEASDVSDRVVIAWPKPYDRFSQWHNDIVYVASDDGLTWDFVNDIVNVTNYADDNDSLWAYCDIDMRIDPSLNIIWNAQWVTDAGVYWRTYLFHYSDRNSSISEICHHPDSLYTDICGAWNRPVCKMNISTVSPSNALIACWTQFDTSDVSAGGFGNGDIYYAVSHDGNRWNWLGNMTQTPSPGCFPGECRSENYASMVKVAYDSLQLFCIEDKDAGGIIMEEGAATENPVLLLNEWIIGVNEISELLGYVTEIDGETPIENVMIRVLLSDMEVGRDSTDNLGNVSIIMYFGRYSVEASKEGYQTEIAHDVVVPWYIPGTVSFQLERAVDIDDESPLPHMFRLDQNYPNPFNASTTISFSLKDSGPVKLDIFDITGLLVTTLIDKYLPTGEYDLIWNAKEFSSGIYIFKLTSGGNMLVKKAVLVK